MHKAFLRSKGSSRTQLRQSEEWAKFEEREWFRILPPREQEALVCGHFHAAAQDWKACSLDLSQRIDRLTFGKDGVLPTITPGNRTWLC
eukprot:15452227-Alexandrium_andersonii.AAC.2